VNFHGRNGQFLFPFISADQSEMDAYQFCGQIEINLVMKWKCLVVTSDKSCGRNGRSAVRSIYASVKLLKRYLLYGGDMGF
jgi:hypothetical protein